MHEGRSLRSAYSNIRVGYQKHRLLVILVSLFQNSSALESKNRSAALDTILSLDLKFPERKDNKVFYLNAALQIAGLQESELKEVKNLILKRQKVKDLYIWTKSKNLFIHFNHHLTVKGQEKLRNLEELEKFVGILRNVKFGDQEEYQESRWGKKEGKENQC